MNTWEKVLLAPDACIREALLKIDSARTQFALVVDDQRRLIGTLTDGDIRRGLIRGLELSDPVRSCMCTTPATAPATQSREAILLLMRRRGVHHVPLVDEHGIVVGLEMVDDFLMPKPRDNWVVLMAGGPGTRLKQLTERTPKPMLKVGDRPLLETILRSYIDQGFRRFYLAVNYKAEVIESYFGDGERLGVEIVYLRESKRLGTAGALSLLPEAPSEPIIVTNGDLLVRADYVDMLDTHIRSGSAATMAVREYEFQIPYGVVRTEEGCISRIEEKPIHRSLVSAGMYVLSPEVLRFVPGDAFFDMPTLFDDLIAQRLPTRCYVVQGYWLDIGCLPDYEKANNDYNGIFQ